MAKSKISLMALAFALLSLLGIISPPSRTAATPDEVKWYKVNIPAEGAAGNWMLASGSNVQHLTMAVDGTIYCYANPSGLRSHNNIICSRYNASNFYALAVKPYLDT